MAARNLSYKRKAKDSDSMKSVGKVPTDINEWPKFRRHVYKMVCCTCGIPQMGTDMLRRAEAHKGPGHKIKLDDSWERVDAHLSLNLYDAMVDPDMIREAITLGGPVPEQV